MGIIGIDCTGEQGEDRNLPEAIQRAVGRDRAQIVESHINTPLPSAAAPDGKAEVCLFLC